MASVGVKVEGLRATVRALERAGVEAADLKEVFGGIAAYGARVVSSKAPARSGALRASIRGNKAKNRAVVAAGKKRVPYAGAINYGWKRRNIAPSLFMQRSDTRITPEAVKMLDEGLTKMFKKVGLS